MFKNQLIPQRNRAIADSLLLCAKLMGQSSIDEEVYKLAQKEFLKACESTMAHWSMDEICDLIRLGAIGELVDPKTKTPNNTHFCAKNVMEWVRVYREHYRPKLVRLCKSEAKALPEAKEPKKLSEQEVDEYVKEMYRQYHEDGTLYADTFRILKKYRGFKMTEQAAMRILEGAKIRVRADLDKRVQKGSLNIPDYIEARDKGFNARVNSEAKRLAVGEYFDKMKLREKVKH